MSMMTRCPQCGAPNSPSRTYCYACGGSFYEAPPALDPAPTATFSTGRNNSPWTVLLTLVGIIALVLGIAFTARIAYQGRQDTRPWAKAVGTWRADGGIEDESVISIDRDGDWFGRFIVNGNDGQHVFDDQGHWRDIGWRVQVVGDGNVLLFHHEDPGNERFYGPTLYRRTER